MPAGATFFSFEEDEHEVVPIIVQDHVAEVQQEVTSHSNEQHWDVDNSANLYAGSLITDRVLGKVADPPAGVAIVDIGGLVITSGNPNNAIDLQYDSTHRTISADKYVNRTEPAIGEAFFSVGGLEILKGSGGTNDQPVPDRGS